MASRGMSGAFDDWFGGGRRRRGGGGGLPLAFTHLNLCEGGIAIRLCQMYGNDLKNGS